MKNRPRDNTHQYKIAKIHYQNGDGKYHTEWDGFPTEQNTDEPLENVVGTGAVDVFDMDQHARKILRGKKNNKSNSDAYIVKISHHFGQDGNGQSLVDLNDEDWVHSDSNIGRPSGRSMPTEGMMIQIHLKKADAPLQCEVVEVKRIEDIPQNDDDNVSSSSEEPNPDVIDHSILNVGSRILVLYKDSLFKATIRKRREKDGNHDFLIHYDGNKKTNVHWITVDKISRILENNVVDTPPPKKRKGNHGGGRRKAAPSKQKQTIMTHHESEWIYSTILSKQLTPLNEYIHELPSVSHPTELFIASCGYAFNPVMFPLWPILIYALSYRGLSNTVVMSSSHEPPKWQTELLSSFKLEYAALVNTALYLSSVLITLIFTEIGKASFATSRPVIPTDGGYNSQQWTRRYGKLVASLKSKHSFPSGDSAQAMNLCMFLFRYVPLGRVHGNALPITLMLFGTFLPGVAFARVFYRCHWIEDCIGGIALSYILHQILIPALATTIMTKLAPLLFAQFTS